MIHTLPSLLLVGLLILCSFYLGKSMKWMRLPSIIGFMLVGVAAGNILELDILDALHITEPEGFFDSLSFIPEVALALVALIIGLELSFVSLKKQGLGIVIIIFAESFGAFFLVTAGVFFLTKSWPLALLFGAIAPASAPAGTVAVIQEFRAKGPLTKALYAVVGFDDGLGIIIFGFAAAIVRTILLNETGEATGSFAAVLLSPVKEVLLSVVIGVASGMLLCILGRRLKSQRDLFILVFAFILLTTGICKLFHLSLILTNMTIGMIIVNTQPRGFMQKIGDEIGKIMPLIYVIFFALAGANLHLSALPSLGILGITYFITRSTGLVIGSRIGAIIGKVEDTIKKYLGLGILSQAGVAIGLSLIVKNEFAGMGKIVETMGTTVVRTGDTLGVTVITTITATCILFEIIGPILTKIALTKANEIESDLL